MQELYPRENEYVQESPTFDAVLSPGTNFSPMCSEVESKQIVWSCGVEKAKFRVWGSCSSCNQKMRVEVPPKYSVKDRTVSTQNEAV